MPSNAYREWITVRAAALDEIARAHVAVGGSKRGRRYATQQINRAYAVLLASQFQGYCRDLHSECVDHLLVGIDPRLFPILHAEFRRERLLDRGNAQPGSIGADFKRIGIDGFWEKAITHDSANADRRNLLDELNTWRNAIAHQRFDPAKLGNTVRLQLAKVRQWRSACRGLAQSFDEVARQHIVIVTGHSPW
jgi:hypothetical protein